MDNQYNRLDQNEMLAEQKESIIVTNDVSFLKKGTKPVVIIGRDDKSTEPVAGAVRNTSGSAVYDCRY